jgi:hypothetical protein
VQNVTVFAGSEKQAKALVHDELPRLRGESTAAEHPHHDAPAFSVDRIALDAHKLLTHHVTT